LLFFPRRKAARFRRTLQDKAVRTLRQQYNRNLVRLAFQVWYDEYSMHAEKVDKEMLHKLENLSTMCQHYKQEQLDERKKHHEEKKKLVG
jgi:hypothetical protein